MGTFQDGDDIAGGTHHVSQVWQFARIEVVVRVGVDLNLLL
jgi:hypothetical protein